MPKSSFVSASDFFSVGVSAANNYYGIDSLKSYKNWAAKSTFFGCSGTTAIYGVVS